jgi:hypothetical protein
MFQYVVLRSYWFHHGWKFLACSHWRRSNMSEGKFSARVKKWQLWDFTEEEHAQKYQLQQEKWLFDDD